MQHLLIAFSGFSRAFQGTQDFTGTAMLYGNNFSRIELKYLLLPPRSALTEAPAGPTPKAFDATATTLLLVATTHKPATLGYRSLAQAPSIFRASLFGSYPGGNFGGNQVLDGSISLSPLHIPKFIDRFVRQNRYGLPSEFPLTSSCSSIVRHLWGRNLYAAHLQAAKTGPWCAAS
ncbi:unnamed protein product [Heligmosomoides polygyrus]|uniref:Secreted protein n=1 Tax=Heligmosomoides polygyrus TaxID=6339 RepID=A0A183GS75_HELPZ|nr:unnamed protein product [Heligmosomoides polygyrus]